MSNANESNMSKEIVALYETIKSASQDIMQAGEKGDVARGTLLAATILLGKADDDVRTQLCKRAQMIVTTRNDNNAREVDGAKAWFADFIGAPDKMKQKEMPDRMKRDRHNNKNTTMMSQARFIAFCVIAIDNANAWDHFHAAKNKGNVRLHIDGARAIWPERHDALSEVEESFLTVASRAGAWRTSALAERGKEIARHKGWTKKEDNGPRLSIRDAASNLFVSLEKRDTKLDRGEQLALLSLWVSIGDELNSASYDKHLSSENVRPLRAEAAALIDELTTEIEKAKTPAPKAA